jgi:hypothetical protein
MAPALHVASAPAEDELEVLQLPLTDLESSDARPPTRRKRVVQMSLVLCAIVVVMIFFRGLVPSAHPRPRPFHRPSR